MKERNRFQDIRRVVRQIADAHHPERIILFGSCAYGKPSKDSDVDLLILMNSRMRAVDRAVRIYRSLKYYPFPMDIIVRTPAEVRERLRLGDSFFSDILRHGKVLYAR